LFAKCKLINQAKPIVDIDGKTVYNTDSIINEKKNNFKDWLCHYGKNVLYITPDGNVRGSACGVNQKQPLANIYNDETYNIPEPVVCPYSECSCLADVELITKENVLNKPETKALDKYFN